MSARMQGQVGTARAPSVTPVQSGLLQRKCACGGSAGLTGECAECDKERLTLQRRAANQSAPSAVPPVVDDVLRSPGQSLDGDTRGFMESRFGHDFSQVRVHADSLASDSARAVNAIAYTVGKDLVFQTGQYRPETETGKRRLAHELTHVVQQSGADPGLTRNNSDFSRVRIHHDDAADRSARDLRAAAFTVGERISLRRDAYAPRTPAGVALIAHELAHVVQQSRPGGSPPDASSELAADHATDLALRGEPVPADVVGATAPGVACQSNEESRRRRGEAFLAEYPGIAYALDPGKLDREYRAALSTARRTGDWTGAAEKLNGFNHQDIQARLAELSDQEVGYLHQGAFGNPRVGPDSNIAKLTDPKTPRASTVPPADRPRVKTAAPAPATTKGPLTDEKVRAMSNTDKLLAAYGLAPIGAATAGEIANLISPKSLVIALLTFAGIWLVAQVTPAGWAADIGLGITALFIGTVLFDAIKHLIGFAKAVDAQNEADLQVAGDNFAKAVAEIGVQTLVLLVTHSKGGGPKGAARYEGPTPKGFVDMVTNEGFVVRVPAEKIPASAVSAATTISPALAAQLGVKGATTSIAMMSALGGGGKSSSGSGGSGSAKQTDAERLQAKYADRANVSYPPEEWARIEQLETNFPKLAEAKLRPQRRARTGAEHAFEERMQTTQSNYSLAAYNDQGVKVIELDNITPQGWIQEIKIQQTDAEKIVAQLRREAAFANDYGLRGVQYSIDPPTIADEVELLVSNSRMVNVFRVN